MGRMMLKMELSGKRKRRRPKMRIMDLAREGLAVGAVT